MGGIVDPLALIHSIIVTDSRFEALGSSRDFSLKRVITAWSLPCPIIKPASSKLYRLEGVILFVLIVSPRRSNHTAIVAKSSALNRFGSIGFCFISWYSG